MDFEIIGFYSLSDFKKLSKVKTEDVLVSLMLKLPLNSFWITHQSTLLPIISNTICTWKASDNMEHQGDSNEKSFVYRASFYQGLLMVVTLEKGFDFAYEHSDKILNVYGESFEDYKKEFNITV
jgi:predicted CDP-diglyceride synthetase/phosphatidate cytidylyltransferase